MANNIDYSIALSYILGSDLPIIVASGKGETAKQIKKIAEKHNISIVKNTQLAKILIKEDVGTCIPKETYLAVASIFAFLINKNYKK